MNYGEPRMTTEEALEFIRHHGVVLASAKGPVPRLAEQIAGVPIKGSWWAHPSGHEIFRVFEALNQSPEVLSCRLVGGKLSYVHRRLWPALVRAAPHFSAQQLAQALQEHSAAGHHVARDIPFPQWVPADVMAQSKTLGEQEALLALGPWAQAAAAQASPRRR